MSDTTPHVIEKFVNIVVEGTNKLEKDSIQFKQFIRDLLGDRLSHTECDERLVEQLKKVSGSLEQQRKLIDDLLSDIKDANIKVLSKVSKFPNEQLVEMRQENRRNRQDADSGCYSTGSRVLSGVHSTDLSGLLEAAGARTSSNILVTHPTDDIVTPGKLETGVEKLTTRDNSPPQEHDETNC